jgi:hypothetical protein
MADSAPGRRRGIAIPIASMTISVFWLEPIDQPVMRREHASITAAQYTFPSAVGCPVMSVSHSRPSPATANWRCTRTSFQAAEATSDQVSGLRAKLTSRAGSGASGGRGLGSCGTWAASGSISSRSKRAASFCCGGARGFRPAGRAVPR